jgi:hypothetical protein
MRAHDANDAARGRLAGLAPESEVHHPGLPAPPRARGEADAGFGGMISFDLPGSTRSACGSRRICALGESLGGVESLISHPATMRRTRRGFEERAPRHHAGARARSVGTRTGRHPRRSQQALERFLGPRKRRGSRHGDADALSFVVTPFNETTRHLPAQSQWSTYVPAPGATSAAFSAMVLPEATAVGRNVRAPSKTAHPAPDFQW